MMSSQPDNDQFSLIKSVCWFQAVLSWSLVGPAHKKPPGLCNMGAANEQITPDRNHLKLVKILIKSLKSHKVE